MMNAATEKAKIEAKSNDVENQAQTPYFKKVTFQHAGREISMVYCVAYPILQAKR